MRRQKRWALVLVAATVVGAGAWMLANDEDQTATTTTPASPVQLASLELTDESASIPEYRRDEFGDPWADVDGNGCDTRNDVLARDLDEISFMTTRPCVVDSGILVDPYTGATIAFQHGEQTSMAVQIEHVIPLSLAWRSGAWQWTDEERLAFANDQTLLLAVDGPTNQSRGDSDLDQWLPPNDSFTCEFVALVLDGLERYDLTITSAAHDAAAAELATCPAR